MSSALPTPNGRAQPGAAIVFDEIGERAAIAATYAGTAADFAALGDRRGVSYALRCAAMALASANDAAMLLPRPAPRDGGAA